MKTHRMVTAAVVIGLLVSACSNSGAERAESSGDGGIDTALCEDPAKADAPIEDTVKIGWTAALSGPFAASVESSFAGMRARIAHENEQGGIGGVPIELLEADDAFDPAKTKTNVTEFLQRDDVDVLGVAGAGQLGAIIDDQNAACVPTLMTGTSAPQYRDIEQYPWTTQSLPSGSGEATFKAEFIATEKPDAKVGILENQTESGKALSETFTEAAAEAGVEIVTTVPLTDDPVVGLTSIQEAGADVLVVAGIVTDCLAVSRALSRVAYTPELVFQAPTCSDAATIFEPAGDVADGQIVGAYMKIPSDPTFADDEGVQEYVEQATSAGLPDPANAFSIDGWIKADVTIAALQAAAELDGGLTRANIMRAAQDQDYTPPMYLDGISFLSTPEKFTGVSAMQALRWNAQEKSFELLGDPIDIG